MQTEPFQHSSSLLSSYEQSLQDGSSHYGGVSSLSRDLVRLRTYPFQCLQPESVGSRLGRQHEAHYRIHQNREESRSEAACRWGARDYRLRESFWELPSLQKTVAYARKSRTVWTISLRTKRISSHGRCWPVSLMSTIALHLLLRVLLIKYSKECYGCLLDIGAPVMHRLDCQFKYAFLDLLRSTEI